jgi:hypothetical protein
MQSDRTRLEPFVPSSINYAKSRARALRQLTPALKLSDAQELVARAFGWPDWHALAEAIKRGEEPSPMDDQVPSAVRAQRREVQRQVLGGHLGERMDIEQVLNSVQLTAPSTGQVGSERAQQDFLRPQFEKVIDDHTVYLVAMIERAQQEGGAVIGPASTTERIMLALALCERAFLEAGDIKLPYERLMGRLDVDQKAAVSAWFGGARVIKQPDGSQALKFPLPPAVELGVPQRRVSVSTEVDVERFHLFLRMVSELNFGRSSIDEVLRLRREDFAAGQASLRHLFEVAQGDSGQCRYIAQFLLGLYNGTSFPFDLTNLRALDANLFEHCMRVLRMDARDTKKEVHQYFENGGARFQKLARDWGLIREESAG